MRQSTPGFCRDRLIPTWRRSVKIMRMMALSEYDVRSLEQLFQSWGHPRGNTKKLLRRYYESAGESIDGVQVARELKARVLSEMALHPTRILPRREATD